MEPSLSYVEIPEKGHALLVEAPNDVAEAVTAFILRDDQEDTSSTNQGAIKIWEANFISVNKKVDLKSPTQQIETTLLGTVGSLDFELFSVSLMKERSQNPGVFGIGWGQKAEISENDSLKQRSGFAVQLLSKDGMGVGIGEVSPLGSLHPESLEMAGEQLEEIACRLSKVDPETVPLFDAAKILSLDGSLEDYIKSFCSVLDVHMLHSSVRSGLEMAILSLASQILRIPIHQALVSNAPNIQTVSATFSTLPLNGLKTRDPVSKKETSDRSQGKAYPSWKVKVGHQNELDDIKTLRSLLKSLSNDDFLFRVDANRGYTESSFLSFAENLKALDVPVLNRIEYIEEPVSKQIRDNQTWSLRDQVEVLERCFDQTSIPYALDETIYDLMELHQKDFDSAARNLREVFGGRSRGCAAVVLKPSLLGLETCLRLARLVKIELGIGAVFTSSFDSGIGLAYTSFLGSVSDASPRLRDSRLYPHGLSTFDLMRDDTISPCFGSYVNQNGILNVASLSRAFYGLGLDEIQSLSSESMPPSLPDLAKSTSKEVSEVISMIANNTGGGETLIDAAPDDFEASTSTSSSGRDIVLVASLPLPFPADVACARFTDLPQQPRWSPWLASVAYLDAGSETEWTLRVRGVNFRWRARSELLESPYKGIRWRSTSGVKNTGVVEFIPSSGGDTVSGSCTMKVQMAFVAPRLLSSLFRGTIMEDFLRNKIMKWSLEMFRDVVKGDLALEEGNVELGDALFGAVEGKASAIEATLASSASSSRPSSSFDDEMSKN
jgi:O-succinylbenzoate synthase/uncharacterized membrane protein